MTKAQLNVKGMSCQHCVRAVESTLQKVGVIAQVDLENEKVSVEFDENKITLQTIKGLIEDQGYDVA